MNNADCMVGKLSLGCMAGAILPRQKIAEERGGVKKGGQVWL